MGEMSEEILGFTLGKPHESDDVKWIQVETIKLPRSFLVITSASLPSQPLSKAREKQKKWKITEITLLSIHVCMFFYLQNVDFPHRMRPTGCWSPHPATCPKAQQFAMTVGDIHSSAA